jgi:DNA-binding CsgD family transcriptional regulator
MQELLERLLAEGNVNSLQAVRIILVYCQIGIYFFFAISLLSVWSYYFRNKRSFEDLGLVFLSLFFIFLIVSSIIQLSAESYQPDFDPIPAADNTGNGLEPVKTFLSSLNSFFLFLSFVHFDVIRYRRIRFFSQNQWLLIATILFALNVSASSLLAGKEYSKYPDLLNSIILFSTLGFLLFKNFQYRKATELSILSLLVCLLIIINQFYWLNIPPYLKGMNYSDFFGPRVVFNFTSLVLISALGTIFLSLAFTWVFEEFSTREKETEIDRLRQENISLKDTFFHAGKLTKTDLTKTEKEVLRLVCLGLSYREIADMRSVSEEGIITHVRNMERKLGIKGKGNLADYGNKNGFGSEDGS